MEIISSAPRSVSQSDYADYKIMCAPEVNSDLELEGAFYQEPNHQALKTEGLLLAK